jgi:hypothetical protein
MHHANGELLQYLLEEFKTWQFHFKGSNNSEKHLECNREVKTDEQAGSSDLLSHMEKPRNAVKISS